MNVITPTRREFTSSLGAIVVAFSLDPKLALAQQSAPLPGSLAQNRMLDAWIRINADGSATIFPGKVELGQGTVTATMQLVADELDVPMSSVKHIQSDTWFTVDQGNTAGSQSTGTQNGTAGVRQAAAEARAALLVMASRKLGAPVSRRQAVQPGADRKADTEALHRLQRRRHVGAQVRHSRQGVRQVHLHAGHQGTRHAPRARCPPTYA